jgi:hypothetical protein
MTIREIPKSYEYRCDKCGATHLQENASGQYSNSTPPEWMSLRVGEYSKAPVDILLCQGCRSVLTEYLQNSTLPGITSN